MEKGRLGARPGPAGPDALLVGWGEVGIAAPRAGSVEAPPGERELPKAVGGVGDQNNPTGATGT